MIIFCPPSEPSDNRSRVRKTSSSSTLNRKNPKVPGSRSSKSGGSRKERGKKVWQFLLDLLMDPNSNPTLIRWENKHDGVFRLVEHDSVAQRWGLRRDKNDLSYDYFARTLRYQYTTNMLESVPERKLVYKFGPEIVNRLRQEGKI